MCEQPYCGFKAMLCTRSSIASQSIVLTAYPGYYPQKETGGSPLRYQTNFPGEMSAF